jgi:hypothetical protein
MRLSAFGLLLLTSAALGQESRVEEIAPSRTYLRWERPAYRNYALSNFSNYPNHSLPYQDTPHTFYGPLGTELITGYDLFFWTESRGAAQEYGSSIFKPNEMYALVWNKVYDATVVGRDGYGDWGYSLIIGDNLMARLSPLTLSMTDFNGFRLDLAVPHFNFTGMASRIERPHVYQLSPADWTRGQEQIAFDSTILLGSRLEADLGIARLGFNGANSHVYHSNEPGNSLKGVLRPDQPLMEWVIVRFSDDSPADGDGGASVHDVAIYINGEPRKDLEPSVIRHKAGATPQVGSRSAATGRFRVVDYTLFNGHRRFYRGRDELPLYADYLYRLDHRAGIDVSDQAQLSGLLPSYQLESPAGILTADGAEQLVYLFDLTSEPRVESVELEAVLAGDYRVDVSLLTTINERARNYHGRYRSTFYRTLARARGNNRDGSNLRRVRLPIGEDTGIFTYSTDLSLTIPGFDIAAEYARSTLHSRYPAHVNGAPAFEQSPRFSRSGSAFYANATRWFERGRLGAELFSINPGFATTYRTYLDAPPHHGNLVGMFNETVYWDLVEDNDDGDRFPDRRIGNVEGFAPDSKSFDLDGVFLAQDEDNDGFPELNRDGDLVPDYDEPFMMFDVEPNRYVYGLDRNNNDEPDQREDDGQVDYPYDPDQRGYHLFFQLDVLPHLSVALGRYRVREVGGGGRNRSSYMLITFDRSSWDGERRVLVENNLRRTTDDIADEYLVADEISNRNAVFHNDGLEQRNSVDFSLIDKPPIVGSSFVTDNTLYQDSYVNETYLDARSPFPGGFSGRQQVRLRLNWQRGGQLYNGVFQRERRLDFWTSISRLEHVWQLGGAKITTQYKLMLLRLVDQERNTRLQSELRSIPILRFDYPLLPRTTLRAGFQGIGPLPYRLRDETSGRNSFEQRTAFVTLTNFSKYFGYELITIAGISRNSRDFDARFQDVRDFDAVSFFVRTLLGFSSFGRPI